MHTTAMRPLRRGIEELISCLVIRISNSYYSRLREVVKRGGGLGVGVMHVLLRKNIKHLRRDRIAQRLAAVPALNLINHRVALAQVCLDGLPCQVRREERFG
jgi:hypothetical protein